MRRFFLKLSDALDRITTALCAVACALLTLVVLAVVVLRYGFGMGYIALQDLAAYTFAALLALSVPSCLAAGGHVRVDVISERLGPRYLRLADLVALVVFLVPVFGLAIWAYWPEIAYSWSIGERSVETGGLPGLYIVKTALPVAMALTIVQGIAAVLRAFGDDGA